MRAGDNVQCHIQATKHLWCEHHPWVSLSHVYPICSISLLTLAVLSTPAPVSSLAKSTLAGPLVNSRTPVGERRQGQGVKWFILDDTQCKPHVPMCHKFPHVGTGTTGSREVMKVHDVFRMNVLEVQK